MADELRLKATVDDGFSGPLKSLQNQLSHLKASNPTAGLMKDWQGVGQQVNRITSELRTGFMPVMSQIGIGSLGLGAGIASALTGLKQVAFATRDMGIFGRQVGFTTGQLKEMKALGERFGVDWGTTQGAVKTLATNMFDLQRRWGDAYHQLRAMNMGELAEDLVKAPNMSAAYEKIMQALAATKNPVMRAKLSNLFFGTDQIGVIAAEATPKIRAEMKKIADSVTPEMEAMSEKFAVEWMKLEGITTRTIQKSILPAMGPLAKMMEDLNKPVGEGLTSFFDKLNESSKVFESSGWLGVMRLFDGANGPLARKLAPMPGDTILDAEDKATALKRQLENAENAIKITEGQGGDASRARARRDDLSEQLRKLTEEIKALRGAGGGATAQPSSFGIGGGGVGAMFHNASFGGMGGGNPFAPGFWAGVYNQGMGGNAFRGGGGGGGRSPVPPPGPGTEGGVVGGMRRAIAGGGGAAPGPAGQRGDGRGTKGQAPVGSMMAYAMDELRGLGVPEGNLRAAAAHMVGQAMSESQLNPNQPHDHGTGFGIYGARDPGGRGKQRRSEMFKWLKENGYAHNSAEGQMRYMVREAMTDPSYRRTRNVLMSGDINVGNVNAVTGNFEAPRTINHRLPNVMTAYRTGPDQSALRRQVQREVQELADRAGTAPVSWPYGWAGRDGAPGRTRAGVMEGDPSFGAGLDVSPGDRLMRRAFGANGVSNPAPRFEPRGTVNVHLSGGAEKLNARTSTEGLFRNVVVNRGRRIASIGEMQGTGKD